MYDLLPRALPTQRGTVWLATAGALALSLTACQDAVAPTPTGAPDTPNLSVAPGGAGTETIPGQYIVVFNASARDVPGLARGLTAAHGGTFRFTYERALRGFAANLNARAAEALTHNPNVAFVEQDQVMRASTVETGATWGIDRIDQSALPAGRRA